METIMVLIFFGLVAVMMAITPYITRRTESFGVTIPEAAYLDPELKKLRKQYAAVIIVFSILLAAALFIAVSTSQLLQTGFALAVLVDIAGNFLIYLYFHRKMKAIKKTRNWATGKKQAIIVDPKFRSQKLIFSNAWFLIHASVTAATFLMTWLCYGRIPDRIAMHYDFNGTPTDWVEKSYRTVFELPTVQLFLLILFIWLNTMIARSKQQLNAERPEASLEQNVRFRRRWSAFMIITGLLMILLFFAIQLSFIVPVPIAWLSYGGMGAVLLIVAGAVLLSVITGQGGSRIRVGNGAVQGRFQYDDDAYWKLGVFYFNRNDPSLWVEKRFGSGWTLNFAHPAGWIILGLIILIPLLLGVFFS
ncbi:MULTISPECIES: DUF1648 domain-containing protein [Heyndrickxia]|uniref:DUF5808 domain-containing protein n=1 Tax=Heyndrickxia faecalis TaxID=2824910 RepID=A0AAU7WFY8_9BACI|nr:MULTISPECIES: DUF5808 domain-containing protein [Heyndrickxia]APB38188.1 hypothetical protein BIZ35_16415 [Heyndrickxia coagulans]AWP35926.1 DUF1648 domain-containing protein [Heyndrickxia coagulans]QDI61424.1 DUF1648 domain-containing protein [Heyndrickxia coagulans]QPG53922.1 DUF1648 domain-containing protein [Heyndrickxia coagulans]WNE61999.1 DUF1648 domain-containing protein [Heyndrickxia coagulans]